VSSLWCRAQAPVSARWRRAGARRHKGPERVPDGQVAGLPGIYFCGARARAQAFTGASHGRVGASRTAEGCAASAAEEGFALLRIWHPWAPVSVWGAAWRRVFAAHAVDPVRREPTPPCRVRAPSRLLIQRNRITRARGQDGAHDAARGALTCSRRPQTCPWAWQAAFALHPRRRPSTSLRPSQTGPPSKACPL
jgi:hypothetical protein